MQNNWIVFICLFIFQDSFLVRLLSTKDKERRGIFSIVSSWKIFHILDSLGASLKCLILKFSTFFVALFFLFEITKAFKLNMGSSLKCTLLLNVFADYKKKKIIKIIIIIIKNSYLNLLMFLVWFLLTWIKNKNKKLKSYKSDDRKNDSYLYYTFN